jgi:hypothetical protein
MPEVKGICASCGDPLDSGFLCSKCNGDDDVDAELTTLRQRLAEAEAEIAKEQGRWQDATLTTIVGCLDADDALVGEHRRTIDGAGCDSGDPLDVSIAEIRLGMASYSDALSETRAKLVEAEAEKSRLVSAMTAENLRVAADAARWEGAARVLGELCVATNLNKKCEEMGETDNPEVVESQMSAMGRLGSAYLAALSNPTASALVREGGGGA